MFKKLISFIMILALAMSCAAFADGEIMARSATVKVTVNAYKITPEMIKASAGTSDMSTVLATYEVDYKNGQATDTTWTFTQNGDPITPDTNGNKATLAVKDLKLGDSLVSTITVKAVATITTKSEVKPETEEVTLTFVIVDDDIDEDEEFDPTDDDPSDNDEDDPEDEKDGKDEEDKRTVNGLIDIDILVGQTNVMDGDIVTVTAVPTVNEQLKTACKILDTDVVTTMYVQTTDFDTQKISTTNTDGVTVTFTANYGNLYKIWAVGTLTLPAVIDNIKIDQ